MFGKTAPQRSAFAQGAEGDAAHADATLQHLVRELGADIGGEAPKFQTFLPRVVDAVQARYGASVAKDILTKLIDGVRQAMRTLRDFFDVGSEYGQAPTESQKWVTNLDQIHDTLARMYAERFGAPLPQLAAPPAAKPAPVKAAEPAKPAAAAPIPASAAETPAPTSSADRLAAAEKHAADQSLSESERQFHQREAERLRAETPAAPAPAPTQIAREKAKVQAMRKAKPEAAPAQPAPTEPAAPRRVPMLEQQHPDAPQALHDAWLDHAKAEDGVTDLIERKAPKREIDAAQKESNRLGERVDQLYEEFIASKQPATPKAEPAGDIEEVKRQAVEDARARQQRKPDETSARLSAAEGRDAALRGEARTLPRGYLADSMKPLQSEWFRGYDGAKGEQAARAEPRAPEEPKPASPDARQTEPDHRLAERIALALEHPEPLSARGLQRIADRVYGGTLAEGKYTRDRLYDAIELGVNRYIQKHPERFNPAVDAARAKATAEILARLKDSLPTQTVRAGEKDRYQQFSTPPDYAYAANWIAHLKPTDHVLEPSAGVGGLAVHAMNAGVRETTVNELSEKRRGMIDALEPTRVTGEDAAQLHNILPADVRPTVV
jgi:hypothetical protein